MNKKVLSLHKYFPLFFAGCADVILLFLGYRVEDFTILKQSVSSAGDSIYYINNSNLMIVVAICLLNILAIVQSISNHAIYNQLQQLDASGIVSTKISRIEAHLVNYDERTIAFELLSSIENDIGLKEPSVNNEIWILTNNFEEKEDSSEGKELREAIISNLKTNVNYYYIIPDASKDEFTQLCDKLHKNIAENKTAIKGNFNYLVDERLDFIPSPLYDIILYIKVGTIGETRYADSDSKIYYCFSKETDSKNCFYQEISRNVSSENGIWKLMMDKVIHYDHSKFVSVELDNTEKIQEQFKKLSS